MSPADGAQAGRPLTASGPTLNPWLGIFRYGMKWTGVFIGILAVAALVVAGISGAGSVLFGWALVIAFSGVSLLTVHVVGRDNPHGAMAMFALIYIVKVVVFAAVLIMIGRPDWLEAVWFFTAAIGTVVVWQVAEIRAFSRIRFQLYDDVPREKPSDKGEKDV
ncbi:ATP synthase protein I [Arthrobacter sp. UYP6]